MEKNSKVYIAGHNGMVGSAIHRSLITRGFKNIITVEVSELDLRNPFDVDNFFKVNKPEYVFLAAAIVGGIQANIDNPVKFLLDNIKIQNNVIESAYKYGVKRLVFLGSSCIYPRLSEQPMKEEYLLSGKLEPTNEGYALAKITGLKLIEYYNRQYGTQYLSVMPCNLYGYNDSFDKKKSHVIAATIMRIDEAIDSCSDKIEIWGDGSARREFMFVDDLADAVIFLTDNYFENEIVNIGVGYDVSIHELNKMVCDILGFEGEITFDLSKPNGMPQKLLSVHKLNEIGWKHKVDLEEGLRKTYNWYLKKVKK